MLYGPATDTLKNEYLHSYTEAATFKRSLPKQSCEKWMPTMFFHSRTSAKDDIIPYLRLH